MISGPGASRKIMKKVLKIIFKVVEVIYKTVTFWKTQKPEN